MRFFVILILSQFLFSQETPSEIKKLLQFYPQISHFKDNTIYFKDGSNLLYDDRKKKSDKELLELPDIQDQFHYEYNSSKPGLNDAGRIRNEDFFKKIYGSTKIQVQNNLTEIIWCPKLVNQKIKVTTVNGIDKIVKKLSKELDNNPDLKPYLMNIAGTFNWRKIAGTNRLSMHSYGMTIDINTSFSNYWQWDCKCFDEKVKLTYKNRIPLKLIQIFQKYGFIWGGNWYHYDTMHFEYRPELLN